MGNLPRLTVDTYNDRTIYDDAGRVMDDKLRGVCIPGYYWSPNEDDRFDNRQQFNYLENWGVSIIRLSLEGWMNFGSDSSVRDKMDDMIEWANDYGMYVIISGWHLTNGQSHPYNVNVGTWSASDWDDWRDFWVDSIATRYSDHTNVIYELLNEPHSLNTGTQQTEFRQCIDSIRVQDPYAPIMVMSSSDSSWANRSLDYEQSDSIARSNIIFSEHFYYMDRSGEYGYRWNYLGPSQETCRAYLNTQRDTKWCLDNNRPVFISEWNATDGAFDGNSGDVAMRNIQHVLTRDGYCGYTAWDWQDGGQYNVLADWNGHGSNQGSRLREFLFPRDRNKDLLLM